MELPGAVAVVTGGGSGLGWFVVERRVAEGCRVVVADVEPGASAAREEDSRVAFVRCDVRVAADLERVVELALSSFGRLDVVVNNAGGVSRGAQWPDARPSEWGATLDLNFRGPMLLTQLALEPMRAHGGGAVVNIASSAGLGWEVYDSPEYGAAMAGLIRFTTSVAGLASTVGVRVNCIAPHWVGLERAYAQRAAMSASERAAAGAFVEPEAVAEAVVWLACAESACGVVVEMPGGSERRLLGTGDGER